MGSHLGGDLHNTERVHPEWQHLKKGDDIWMAPAGRYGQSTRLEVIQIRPDRVLIVGHPGRDSGAFVLVPTEGGKKTRLLVRDRDEMGSGSILSAFFTNAVYRPGHFVMERGQMLGIKALAEGAPSERTPAERISLVCVVVAALGLMAMLFPSNGWPRSLVVASAGAGLATLVFFLFYPSVVYGLLIVAVVLAALAWTYEDCLRRHRHAVRQRRRETTR